MTPDELREIGEALFGLRWQTPLAHHLGMRDAAEVRKWLSRTRAVPEYTAERLRALMEQDKWIVGIGSESGLDYVIHTRFPRFLAKIAEPEDGGMVNTIDGLTYSLRSGAVLCEFIWSAPIPDEGELISLLRQADAAIERVKHL